eukprot:PITA_07128
MSLVVELGEQAETKSTPITSWNLFCEALRERFYPPGYIQNLLAKWLQLRQLPNQSVQAYIDVFCKLRIQLHISDPDEVLIIKFNSGLLMLLRREVELFDSASLDKAFIRALAVERKVGTRIRYPQARNGPSSFDSSNVASASSPTPHRTPWCTFHKTNSHASADCRVLKNLRPQKTLFTEVEQPKATTPLPAVSLENPTEVDPSLILMTANAPNTSVTPLFTHNCQIKHELATLILDNGSQKNLVSQDLVARMCLPTTPHPHPYQLGWVRKDGPRLTISQCCAVTFAIGPFRDTVVCDVSPLDCADLLLGIPYQEARHAVYHATNHQYHLQHDGHTYVLTSSASTSTQPSIGKAPIMRVNLNQDVSLCLVRPVKPDNLTNPVPPSMAPLLHEFANVFTEPTGLPPARSVEHHIDLIPGASLPNAPSYRLAPREATEIECQIEELLTSGHIQPSSSPCASPAFIIPKKDTSEWRLVTDYRALNKATVKNRYPLPRIEDLLDHLHGACFFTKMDLTAGYHQVRMHASDTWKTAFKTKFGLFEWLVMPFGLTNAPATFMRFINDIFRAHLGQRKEILFWTNTVQYLGFIIDNKGVRPDPSRVQALAQWPAPSSAHDLKSFMGGINFYRNFVSHFSQLARPLHQLSHQAKFIWDAESEQHFAQIKSALCSAPVLRFPDMNQPFEIETDASQFAIGAVLKQGGHPVAYHSEALADAKLMYSTYDKEFYSLVQALKQWRHYILGKETILHTDHHPLIFINSQQRFKSNAI